MWSVFCAIKRSWSQHFVEQFSAFIILAMTYSAVLFVALSLTNIQKLFEMWGEVQQASVYLKPDIKESHRSKVMQALKAEPMIESVQVVTSQESAANFEKRFSKVTSNKINAKSVAKYFPSYLVLELNQTLAYKSGLGNLDQFVEKLKSKFPEISNVSYGKSWITRYVSVLSAISFVGWFLIASFLLAAVIVTASVIKTILFSKRDEIEILEFIGADDKSIYLPHVINALLLSSVSFVFALLINYVFYSKALTTKSDLVGAEIVEQIHFINPALTLSLLFMTLLSVLIYSLLTIFNLLPRHKKALLIKEVMH